MKILPNTQRLGKLTFDSNQVRKSSTNPNVLIAKASDGKDYGVVRKSDGSYDFAGSSRNSSFGDRMATASANPNIGTRLLETAGLLASEPQRMMTRKLTNNRYNNPEEVVADSKLPDGMLKNTLGFAAGMVIDPFNLVGAGAGIASKASKYLPKLFKSSKVTSKINNVTQPFKSEINWSKWNKEIPNNYQLMKEYNEIEKISKANKSWMKNPDGSAFKGTPEQFVQENSKNFKKAFKESIIRDEKGNIVKMYHGSINKEPLTEYITPKRLENFKRRTQTTKETDHTFFSPKKEIADKYSKRDLLGNDKGIIYENYINVKNPYFTDNYIDVAMPHNLPNINSYDAVTNIKFGKDYFPKDYSELAIPFGNNVKSARGNNGMFDMNNPNIYKGIVPGAIAAGTAASTMSNKDKKNKFKYGGKLLPLLNKF